MFKNSEVTMEEIIKFIDLYRESYDKESLLQR